MKHTVYCIYTSQALLLCCTWTINTLSHILSLQQVQSCSTSAPSGSDFTLLYICHLCNFPCHLLSHIHSKQPFFFHLISFSHISNHISFLSPPPTRHTSLGSVLLSPRYKRRSSKIGARSFHLIEAPSVNIEAFPYLIQEQRAGFCRGLRDLLCDKLPI